MLLEAYHTWNLKLETFHASRGLRNHCGWFIKEQRSFMLTLYSQMIFFVLLCLANLYNRHCWNDLLLPLKDGDLIQFSILKKCVRLSMWFPIEIALQMFWISANPSGLYTAPGDINSVLVKLLFSLPDIFISHFIIMTNGCSKPAYNTVLNSLDPLPYLKNEGQMKAMLLFRGTCVCVCAVSLDIFS